MFLYIYTYIWKFFSIVSRVADLFSRNFMSNMENGFLKQSFLVPLEKT